MVRHQQKLIELSQVSPLGCLVCPSMQDLKAIKCKVHEIPTLEDNIHSSEDFLSSNIITFSFREISLTCCPSAAHRRQPKEGIGALMPLIRSGFPLNEHDHCCRHPNHWMCLTEVIERVHINKIQEQEGGIRAFHRPLPITGTLMA